MILQVKYVDVFRPICVSDNATYAFTRINGELYLSTPQLSGLLQINKSVIREHIKNIQYAYEDAHFFIPNWIYSIELPVRYQKGIKIYTGGVQHAKFYHLSMCLAIANRLKNLKRKRTVTNWLQMVMQETLEDDLRERCGNDVQLLPIRGLELVLDIPATS